jgi:hypothetical protein
MIRKRMHDQGLFSKSPKTTHIPNRQPHLIHGTPAMRLSEKVHLPFDKLTVLSKVDLSTQLRVDTEQCRGIEGLGYPHPSSLRAGGSVAYFYVRLIPRDLSGLRLDSPPCGGSPVSGALHLDILHQPLKSRFFDSFYRPCGYGKSVSW